jgi:hypothetical protein
VGTALVHFDIWSYTTQEFYMKEISSMDFPQHGEVFYFYGQALLRNQIIFFFIFITHAGIEFGDSYVVGKFLSTTPNRSGTTSETSTDSSSTSEFARQFNRGVTNGYSSVFRLLRLAVSPHSIWRRLHPWINVVSTK